MFEHHPHRSALLVICMVPLALACTQAEAPSSTGPEAPAMVAMMTLQPMAPSPKAAPAQPKIDTEAPTELDVPFVPADDAGVPARKGGEAAQQPDQTPFPTTVGQLIESKPCSTAITTRLSAQLAAQMNCIKPGTFSRIDNIDNVRLGQAANPFMQSAAARALAEVAGSQPEQTFTVNSSWRSLVQQHVLKRWEGTCGIRVAADPGTSHHESGLAIDVPKSVTKAFRKTLRQKGWVWYCDDTNAGRWAGCRDVPHHTFKKGHDVRTLSVQAFQMLWNRAHPDDLLPVTGFYGPMTARRINDSPLAGFDTGTTCSEPLTLRARDEAAAAP